MAGPHSHPEIGEVDVVTKDAGGADWSEVEAITFDVDATLYNYPMMMFPRLHRWGRYVILLRHLTRARQIMRREGPQEDLRRRQAEIVAELSGLPVDEAARRIDLVLYDGWNVDFDGVRPYRGCREFIDHVVAHGLRIAIISDYPPQTKLEQMGLMDLPWTAIVECEALGELKPSPRVFTTALEALGLADEPHLALHIGDHYNYDVVGAKRVGMRAAWLRRRWRFTRMPWGEEDHSAGIEADIVFFSWRRLDRRFSALMGWSE